jgi:hypothetical protein
MPDDEPLTAGVLREQGKGSERVVDGFTLTEIYDALQRGVGDDLEVEEEEDR